MKVLQISEYSHFIKNARELPFGRVYPLSVAEGFQSGMIYSSENCVLFRHKYNYSYVWGTPDETQLRSIYELIINSGMKLMFADAHICSLFSEWGGVTLIPRNNYSYPHDSAPKFVLPEGFSVKDIDNGLFDRLKGRVAPSLFWDDSEQFSKYGKGICIMHGDEPASWAFTAGVSSEECDIGIETAESFRHRGLAYAAASALISEILPEKRPLWSCQQSNRGSARIAEKLGFVKTYEYIMIRKAD